MSRRSRRRRGQGRRTTFKIQRLGGATIGRCRRAALTGRRVDDAGSHHVTPVVTSSTHARTTQRRMDENVDTTCALYVKPESARRRTAQMNAGERGKGCNSQRRRPPLRDQMPLAGARLAAIARTAHTHKRTLFVQTIVTQADATASRRLASPARNKRYASPPGRAPRRKAPLKKENPCAREPARHKRTPPALANRGHSVVRSVSRLSEAQRNTTASQTAAAAMLAAVATSAPFPGETPSSFALPLGEKAEPRTRFLWKRQRCLGGGCV